MKIIQNKNQKRKANSKVSYWQSYSDLMSALLLVFVLLMSAILLQSSINFEAKIAAQEQAENEIKQRELELEKQQKRLDDQENTISAQKALLEDQQSVLDDQKEQLDKIIGVKLTLIEQLVEVFKDTELSVKVDDKTGAIMLDSSILFDFNKSDLKPEGKKFLDQFIPLYFGVMVSEEVEPYVAEIIIEGHTDTSGNYISNLKLSQERAFSVASYVFETYADTMDESESLRIRELTTANGRSWNDLVLFEDGTEDADSSRRVEFKFRLKDDEMVDAMAEVLGNE